MKLIQVCKVVLSLLLLNLSSEVEARAPLRECQAGCDFDTDCLPGLLCADNHEKELAAAGHDKRKAYCGPVGPSNFEVCYNPNKLSTAPKKFVPYTPPNPLIGLCKVDCDLDIDCAPGLWCADEHTSELVAAGFHPRFANCSESSRRGVKSYFEVCFDPKILKKEGGGGGDPHFKTYDGTHYSYHGECDMVMARSHSFDEGLGIDVHIRTQIVTDWSLISNSAIRIGEDIFELVNDGSIYFNGLKNVELPIYVSNKYQVTRKVEPVKNTTRTHYTIQLGDVGKITMNLFKGMISVKVDAVLDGTDGLLGVYGKAGMIGRDRVTVMADANTMGAEWQVRDDEPMLFHTIRAPQYPAQCILPVVQKLRLGTEDRLKAEKVCHNIISTDEFENCVQDVMMSGDNEVAEGLGYV